MVCSKNNDSIVVTIMNKNDNIVNYAFNINNKCIKDSINSHSIVTYII